MTEIDIPPEALEKAARAICKTEYGPCDGGGLTKCECMDWRSHAIAAIRAALAAWPGMRAWQHCARCNEGPHLLLPLPKEASDD